MPQLATECRVYERHVCHVPTSCQPTAAHEQRWDAIIVDISQNGIRVNLRRRFERGACLALEMPARDGEEPYAVFARVVHLRGENDGTWSLGCQLVGELSEDELQRIINAGASDSTEGSGSRHVIPSVQLRIALPEGRAVRYRVRQFRAVGAWPLTPGRTVRLRGVAVNGLRGVSEFEVVSCETDGDGWAVQLRLPQ